MRQVTDQGSKHYVTQGILKSQFKTLEFLAMLN